MNAPLMEFEHGIRICNQNIGIRIGVIFSKVYKGKDYYRSALCDIVFSPRPAKNQFC
jgi:hypothetical protein